MTLQGYVQGKCSAHTHWDLHGVGRCVCVRVCVCLCPLKENRKWVVMRIRWTELFCLFVCLFSADVEYVCAVVVYKQH